MSDTEVLEPDTRPRSEIHVGEPAGEPLMDAVDLVAGYLPGVNILNGASLTFTRARSSASSARTAPESPPCSNPCLVWSTSIPAS